MPLAPPIELDPGWIQRIPPIDAATRLRADRHNRVTPNWIQRDTRALLLAENPTRPCAFTLTRPETDQYVDPWSDLGLSLDPSTRDRSAYAGGNPVRFADADGHRKMGIGGEIVTPEAGCGLNYNCGTNTVQERGDNGGCGCSWTTSSSSGGAASITYGGQSVRATRATVRVLREDLISQRSGLAEKLGGLYSYLSETSAACDSTFDRWVGATCQAYQQGATNALHQLDQLGGRRVGFAVKPGPVGAWFATTGTELLGGGSISLGRNLLNESTTDPIYAVGKTVYGAKLVAQGSVLSGAGIAVGTYQDGTHGFAKSSISVAVSAGVTAAAGSSRFCGRVPHKGLAGICSLGVGAGAGIASGYAYDETREALN